MRSNNWETVSVGSVCEAIYDGPHATPTKTDDGPVYLGISNLANGRLDLSQVDHLSENDFVRWTRRVTPQRDDLVFSYETRLGEAALVPEGLRCCLGRRMGLMRPNRLKVDPRFLLYAYLGPEFQQTICARTVHGSTVNRILLTELPDFPIRMPPLDEQKAIAAVLSAFDDKIDLNRRMNETLEAMARAIFKSWFVDFDPVHAKARGEQLPGMDAATAALFPDAFEEVDGRLIPAGWRLQTIGDQFKITMGQSPPGSTYNEHGEGLPFFQGRRDFGFRYPSLRVYCTMPKRCADPGDSLVTVRAPVGDVNMADQRCCIGRGVAAVRHTSGSRSYTYYAMKSLRTHFNAFEGEGTVFGALSKRDFHSIGFLCPTDRVVRAFEAKVDPMDQLVQVNSVQASTLSELRDTLLPQLISGRLRVPVAEKIAEDAL